MVIPVRCLCNAYLQGPWNFRPTTREDQRAETQSKAARESTASIATEGERHANCSAWGSHQFALSVSKSQIRSVGISLRSGLWESRWDQSCPRLPRIRLKLTLACDSFIGVDDELDCTSVRLTSRLSWFNARSLPGRLLNQGRTHEVARWATAYPRWQPCTYFTNWIK